MQDIRLEPFKVEHLKGVDWGAQGWIEPFFAAEEAAAVSNYARSVFYGDIFLGAGGLAEQHEFCAIAWGVPVAGHPKAFISMHMLIKRVLAVQVYPRIAAYIDPEFPQALRWIKALGFRQEGECKPYFFPDGRTASEWVIIRGE